MAYVYLIHIKLSINIRRARHMGKLGHKCNGVEGMAGMHKKIFV